MVIAVTTEGFKELLCWVWSSFGARFHGRVVPCGYRTNLGGAFGMRRTLGAAQAAHSPRDGEEQSPGADKEVKDRTQELVWRGPRSCCPLQLNWKSLDVMQ